MRKSRDQINFAHGTTFYQKKQTPNKEEGAAAMESPSTEKPRKTAAEILQHQTSIKVVKVQTGKGTEYFMHEQDQQEDQTRKPASDLEEAVMSLQEQTS